MVRPYRKIERSKNGQSNTLLETHINKASGKTKNIRWEDDVRKDLQRMNVPNWKTLVQDRRRWKVVVGKVKTLH